MANAKRVAPYKQKGRRGNKKEKIIKQELEQAGIDTQNLKNRIELMTIEQMQNTKEIAAQNALILFKELLEEVRVRIPDMKDEQIVGALLSIWDKIGGKK